MKIIRDIEDVDKSGFSDEGHVPRDWTTQPYGFNAAPFGLSVVRYNKTEWIDRIERQKRLGVHCTQVKQRYGIASLHQGYTNLCWMNAELMAIHYVTAKTYGVYRPLSPASAAGPMTRFANWRGRPSGTGNWSGAANEWIQEHGVNFIDDYPANDLNPDLYNDDRKELALANRVLEWMDFPEQGLSVREKQEIMATAAFNGVEFANGRNRWSHATLTRGLDYVNGEFIWVEDNSGYGRDKNGESFLAFDWVYDDAVAPTVLLPNAAGVTGGDA